jgi:HD-GYP domain-containing protein (c-di-GMP phosphodiesterase class II)
MTFLLDIRTLLAAFLVLSLLSIAVSASTWGMSGKRVEGTAQWFIGFVTFAAGMAGLFARGAIPDFLSLVAANALTMAGGSFQVWGVGRFLGIPKSRAYPSIAILWCAAVTGVSWFSLVDPSLKARVLVSSGFYAGLAGIGLALLATKPAAKVRQGARFATFFFALVAVLFAARFFLTIVQGGDGDWMKSGLSEGAAILAAIVLLTGIAFSELQLVNSRLFYDFVAAAAQARERNEALLGEIERRTLAEDSLTAANVEIASTQKEIMVTLSEVVENRSEETAHHVLRVSEYARILASALGLPDEEVALIADASPMHDIGKIAIPDSVLKKPGPLSEAEMAVMRGHTAIGRDILAKSHRTLMKTAARIAYEHHEYWNGSGYPEGKSGEGISVAGRIVSVCDVFDALAVPRVYKAAWGLPRIMEFFTAKRGVMFEPRLVDVLVRDLDKFKAVSLKYPDSELAGHISPAPFPNPR